MEVELNVKGRGGQLALAPAIRAAAAAVPGREPLEQRDSGKKRRMMLMLSMMSSPAVGSCVRGKKEKERMEEWKSGPLKTKVGSIRRGEYLDFPLSAVERG